MPATGDFLMKAGNAHRCLIVIFIEESESIFAFKYAHSYTEILSVFYETKDIAWIAVSMGLHWNAALI